MLETLLCDLLHLLEEAEVLDDLFEAVIHVVLRIQQLHNLVDLEAAHWLDEAAVLLDWVLSLT